MPVNVIGTLKPKNNGKFPVAEAVDIKVTDGLRLDKALENKADLSTVNFALDNKADKTTTTSLQSQINEIITPVTQDAEVQNARVGVDGTSYTTLKERLDAESGQHTYTESSIKEDIGWFVSYTDNLFPSEVYKWKKGMPSNPNVLRRIYTVPIPVTSGSTLYISGRYVTSTNADIMHIAPSDASGAIDTETWTTWDFSGAWKSTTYTVPNGINYIVLVLDSGSESKPLIPDDSQSVKIYVGTSEITTEAQWYPSTKRYSYADLFSKFGTIDSIEDNTNKKLGTYMVHSSATLFETDGSDIYWKARETYIRGKVTKTISSSAYTTVDAPSGDTGYVKIQNNEALVYKISTQEAIVIAATLTSEDTIPMLVNSGGKIVGGIGEYLYQKWQIDSDDRLNTKISAYMTQSGEPTFEVDGNKVYWKARETYIRGKVSKVISSSAYTTVDAPSGDTGYVKMDNNTALVYDTVNDSVLVKATVNLTVDLIPMLVNSGGNIVGGIGEYLYQKWQLEEATSDASSLDSYWKTFLDNRLPTIHSKDIYCGLDGDSFVWITDTHVPASVLKSPELIKYITDNSSVSNVFCGGDIISKDSTKNAAVEKLYTWQNLMRSLNPITVRGNHDANSEDNSDTSLHISDGEFYSIFVKSLEDTIDTDKKLYFCKDNTVQKIRYIFLDTGCPDSHTIDSEQIQWMQERIEELPSGWYALVLCHQFFTGQTVESGITVLPKDGNGEAISAALDAIYDSVNATIMGVVCGHCHRDYAEYSPKGYPMISTTCDARQAAMWDINYPDRTVGTTTECAFDIYYINTESRHIYTIRIGAGGSDADRTFTF